MIHTLDWNTCYAALWRARKEYLRPAQQIDAVRLSELIGIDIQKEKLIRNTERFLQRKPANNALLWGARGTGKSSLIRALLNEYSRQGLRLIQIDKDDLVDLPEIVDDIRTLNYRFIIFCDDMSFEAGDNHYKALKSAIDGSIETPPENVLIYATSNRRHLLPEDMHDNQHAQRVAHEIHHGDAVEEKISLSERFGLWLAFYQIDMDMFLKIVDSYFPAYAGDRLALHAAARQFSMERASKSGRTARQFFNYYAEQNFGQNSEQNRL